MAKLMVVTGKKAQVKARENTLEKAGIAFKVLLRRGPYDELQAEKRNDPENDWTAEGEDTYCSVLELL